MIHEPISDPNAFEALNSCLANIERDLTEMETWLDKVQAANRKFSKVLDEELGR